MGLEIKEVNISQLTLQQLDQVKTQLDEVGSTVLWWDDCISESQYTCACAPFSAHYCVHGELTTRVLQ